MPRWTTEARQQQAERIRALCPWKRSTGPRTDEGKAKSARNAWKGGVRVDAAHYAKILRHIGATTKRLFSSFGQNRDPVVQPPSDLGQPNTSADLFSSFRQKSVEQRHPSASPPPVGSVFTAPETDELSTDALLARAARLLSIGESLFGTGFV